MSKRWQLQRITRQNYVQPQIKREISKKFSKQYVKMNFQKISFFMAIFINFKCWHFLEMLNTVVLFTPQNHIIASSTTCGYLSPIVANTVSKKSIIAHLLSIFYRKSKIIRFFGQLVLLKLSLLFKPGSKTIFFALLYNTQLKATRWIKTSFHRINFFKQNLILLKNDDFCNFQLPERSFFQFWK
jgi:hypothetical protein